MQKRSTQELTTTIKRKAEEETLNLLPAPVAPSKELVQRILNFSKSLEVKRTKSAGIITTVLS